MNGKRDVEGVEYYSNRKKKYEGGFQFGERNENGKEYELCENIKYDGEYMKELWNGKGDEYICRKLVFIT